MLQSPLELLPVSVAFASESSATSSTNYRTRGSMETALREGIRGEPTESLHCASAYSGRTYGHGGLLNTSRIARTDVAVFAFTSLAYLQPTVHSKSGQFQRNTSNE